MATLGLAWLAGVLSTLSPCVLPLLPLVLGAASSQHRFGPLALAGGLAISFIAIGIFVATIGFAIGLDGDVFRHVAAVMMVLIGIVLVVPGFQTRLALAGGPFADWTERRFGSFSTEGLHGQFGVGLLLGAVWSPCVGPTLGAASLLAAEGRNLPQVAFTMLLFGVGAATPLVILGFLSRDALGRVRDKLLAAGSGAKAGLGILLILIGISIVTGVDRKLETGLVDASPEWLIKLTTRF
ncbi:cytochrome c biogenesis CcdA family protein [Roseiarcaceae bacterium H3SJ34-1]|uniref:cytochrome c biogenesis CcdA family protein n=1 Tax=Terripilifer ovatus TaxID=3032367 RepID=UPI003AB9577D|nr:cytochrome c biogenesis CcdA family protein [Roseiarcaceae bacterium H3SJ34-1]